MVFHGSRSMRADDPSRRNITTTREREKISSSYGTNWTRGKKKRSTNRFHGRSSWFVAKRDLPKSRGRDVDHKRHVKTAFLSKRNQCPGKGKQRNRVSYITCPRWGWLPSNIGWRHKSVVKLWINFTVSRGVRKWKTGSIPRWRRIFWSKQSHGVALYR